MRQRSLVLGALALFAAAPPLFGQADAWQRKWYWGAQGGVFSYSDPILGGRKAAYSVGGHWLITGKRSALYFAFDEIIFPDSSRSAVVDPTATTTGGVRAVDFSRGRRIQATIFAVPTDSKVQVMLGGGFAIHQITNATAEVDPTATLQEITSANQAVAQVDTKAFIVFAGAVQYRVGRWAVFAQYNYIPSARDFLLTSEQHALTAGVRWALTSAHEDVTSEK
jgi:hypothetical protein